MPIGILTRCRCVTFCHGRRILAPKMKTSSLAATLLAVAPAAVAGWTWKEAGGKSINFTSVPGFFVQDDDATSPSGFDYVSAWYLIVMLFLKG